MLFPRLLALAERAWRRAPWEVPYQAGQSYAHGDGRLNASAVTTDWQRFRSRLALQMPLLDRDGVAYRIAPPGARVEGGRLLMNSELPGTSLEYRTGGAGAWRPYRAPVNIRSAVEVRARSADGRRAGRSVSVSPDAEAQ
jgi:hexosaminidase